MQRRSGEAYLFFVGGVFTLMLMHGLLFFFAELLEKAVSRLLHVDRSQHGERVEIRRRLFRLAGVTVSEHGRFMPSASSMLEVLHHMSRAGECRVFHGAHRDSHTPSVFSFYAPTQASLQVFQVGLPGACQDPKGRQRHGTRTGLP